MDGLRTAERWVVTGGFGIAGVLFLLYPVVRPYSDETTVEGLRVMGTGAWVVAHLFAVGAFLLVGLALLVGRDPAARWSRAAVATAVGVVPTSAYYGAETFGLHAVGRWAAREPDPRWLEVVDAIRFQPAAIALFAVGLTALAVGGVLTAVERRTWTALPYALGFVLFLPQFFTPPPVRIAHGALLLVGCWLLARDAWRGRTPGRSPRPRWTRR
ncbi:hypothetical protein GCM10018963_05290 [Saccharothrix longispora]